MATEKVAVLGVSDMNPERDLDGQMVRAVLALIRSGVGAYAILPTEVRGALREVPRALCASV